MSLKENLEKLTRDKPYSLISKGISRSIIQSIMGGSIPSADKIYEMSKVLDVSMEELLTGKKPEQPLTPSFPPEVEKLLYILDHGDQDSKDIIRGDLAREYRRLKEKEIVEKFPPKGPEDKR